MSKSTDISVQSVVNSTASFNYRQPMKFGGRVVEDVCVLRTEIEITSAAGKKKGIGIGEMTMGNAWAWPSKLSSKITLKVLLELANRLAVKVSDAKPTGDPFQVTQQIAEIRNQVVAQLETDFKITGGIPKLAALLASSPLEAAVHDAFSRNLKLNCFDCLSAEFLNQDLSAYLGDEFAGKYPSDYILQKPRQTLPLYHLVGALDPLSSDEIKTRLNDGYPETLEEWLQTDGISHLKLKLAGNTIDWDVGRIVEVTRICESVASERQWKLSFDFNEQCPDEDYVIDLLERIERLSPLSHERLQYIEQPTPRDLTTRTEMTVHRISRLRPVVIDESLTDLASLKLARQRGYTGIALKACKGHSECLLMAAAASEYKMFICFQDLTCIGASFLHSAALASRIPKVAAIEGNGRQYCPIGNAAYMKSYAPLFRVRYGTVPTNLLEGVGLGFEWQPLRSPEPAPTPQLKPKATAVAPVTKPSTTAASAAKSPEAAHDKAGKLDLKSAKPKTKAAAKKPAAEAPKKSTKKK
jgi:L-alanine-DL-glutamate epimerase-like enolase superfamily enzyme